MELRVSPQKGGLVYDTTELAESDDADMDYNGISPSQFNSQNQRILDEQ